MIAFIIAATIITSTVSSADSGGNTADSGTVTTGSATASASSNVTSNNGVTEVTVEVSANGETKEYEYTYDGPTSVTVEASATADGSGGGGTSIDVKTNGEAAAKFVTPVSVPDSIRKEKYGTAKVEIEVGEVAGTSTASTTDEAMEKAGVMTQVRITITGWLKKLIGFFSFW